MVHRTYIGLGPPERAIGDFDTLTPWVRELRNLQAECERLGPDWQALAIPLDGLQTAAYHFTRRPDFYFQVEADVAPARRGNGRLRDPAEAAAAFVALRPCMDLLRKLQQRCRPYGRDYCALDIPRQGLQTAAFHFTRDPQLYAALPPTSFS